MRTAKKSKPILARTQLSPTAKRAQLRLARKIQLAPTTNKIQLPPTTNEYKPDDLEAMRQAFICACHDNPDVSATEPERYDLADALVSVYQKHLTQRELVAAALRKVKATKSVTPSASDLQQI